MIWGEGNPNGDIYVILDNPGAREDRDGNPFVCGTRQTLQQAIQEADIPLEQIYVTYILKRRPARAYEKLCTRRICMEHLKYQLQEHTPNLIVCLGNVALQAFCQDDEMTVKSWRQRWHEVDGYSLATSYHPLAIRRNKHLYSYFLEDWKMVFNKWNG
ncbi:uracil-DNA glycosylase [Bacillus sp. FJAT-49736]|nr:uracil-DNA glycosylase [Bacillus sp. FJAT-49736]